MGEAREPPREPPGEPPGSHTGVIAFKALYGTGNSEHFRRRGRDTGK